jgi:hypothetical protein
MDMLKKLFPTKKGRDAIPAFFLSGEHKKKRKYMPQT